VQLRLEKERAVGARRFINSLVSTKKDPDRREQIITVFAELDTETRCDEPRGLSSARNSSNDAGSQYAMIFSSDLPDNSSGATGEHQRN
jgi:hypothetical protein